MVRDPGEARKEVSDADLIVATERLRARRNDSVFFACGLAALIDLQSWNRLFFLLPAVLGLYAAIAQVNLRSIAAELKRRVSEGEQDPADASGDSLPEVEASDCALENIETGLSRIQPEAALARTETDKEVLRKRLPSLGSRLDAQQPSRETHGLGNECELQEWINTRIAEYGSRPALNAILARRAHGFNKELHGISGPLLDNLLTVEPLMVPAKFWSSELGWRSEKRRQRWTDLLTRNEIEISPEKAGLLVRFYMNPVEWVPHPYVPPCWTLSDFEKFSEYVVPDAHAFELSRKWHLENWVTMTYLLSKRLKRYGVVLGASYRYYAPNDYAEVAILYPHDSSAITVTTIWKGETELAHLVRSVFPDACRQYSPKWLRGQHLDVYVPSYKLGFEYQGEQHYGPVAYFKGEEGYKRTRERDIRKKEACRQAGVVLIEWKYDEPIFKDQLIERLTQVGIELPQPKDISNAEETHLQC